MKKILSTMIIGILISCCFSVQGVFFEQSSTTTIHTSLGDLFFDLKMKILMKQSKFPSLSACIIEDDEVTWSNSYGLYDLDNRKPATENTLYNIGSITKTITSTALMQLWEQGLFELDEDVNKYLPFSLRNPNYPDDPITFRMLLAHSSSLNHDTMEYYWLNFSGDPPFSYYPYPWLEEHLTPGGKWYYPQRWSSTYRPGGYNMYANVNFDIIAYLVERISGELFVDYCKAHIFVPLGMYHTSFNLSELDIDNVAIPYHYHNGEYLQINELTYMLGRDTPPYKYWRIRMYPAGGLYTTVSDLTHFFIAHMNDGVYNDVRILEAETVEEIHTIQPPGNPSQFEEYVYYGLGWTIMDDPMMFNVTLSGHGGGSYGVNTWMYYIHDENIGVIFFTNGDTLYENNIPINLISQLILKMSLYQKAGFNLFSHIDFRNIGS